MSNLSYQGIGPRAVAQIVDSIVIFIVYLLVGFGLVGGFEFNFQGEAAYPIIALTLLIWILYFTILEGTMGATLGKKLAKIKVVREDGSACGIGPAFIRNILRIIDELPFLYIIGIILITRSEKHRLGDRLSKTVVVKAWSTKCNNPTVLERALQASVADRAR